MTKVSNPGVFKTKLSNVYCIRYTHELNEDINFKYRALKPHVKYCEY